MPEQGSLFRRLATEPPFYDLYAGTLHNPAGPFDIFDHLDRQRDRVSQGLLEKFRGRVHDDLLDNFLEVLHRTHEEVLDGLVGELGFATRSALDAALADLRSELERACLEFPGLRERSVYMQMIYDCEESVISGFERQGHRDAREAVMGLRYGLRRLEGGSGRGPRWELAFVPSEIVAASSLWLVGVVPGDLDGYVGENFAAWQRMYLDAAKMGEAVVIGCGG
jgi:hypothetical protein